MVPMYVTNWEFLMKKLKLRLVISIILIILVFSFTSCNLFSTISINPPSWIIGNWSDSTDSIEYTFTSDNITQTASGISISFKEALRSDPDSFNELINNSTEYKFTLVDSGVSIIYRFVKTSATTLNFYFVGSNSIYGTNF